MEVRSGYKQTELGVIPEDWKVVALGDIGECLIGLTYNPKNVKADGTLVLRSSNIQNGTLSFNDNVYVDAEIPQRIRVIYGDILVCVRNGSRALIGKTALLDDRVEGQTFGAFMSVYRTKDFKYIFQQFQSDLIKRQINENIGATINQITNRSLNSFKVPYPNDIKERDAISTALSDVDALLTSQNKLIAKKLNIKQGAIQRLVTGKKRLQGFTEKWNIKNLRDILLDISDGATPSTTNKDNFGGSIGWVVIEDIKDEIRFTKNTLTEKGLRSCAAQLWQPGTLILSTGATIGEVGIAHVSVATKQGICGLVFDAKKADTKFMKYWFVLNKPLLISMAQGSSIKEVRVPTLVKFEINLPPLDEQVAISEVLSDIDAELKAIKQLRDKTQLIKQAMMQELLTGRIRLA